MPDKHGNITVSDVEEVMNGISGQRQAMTFDMQKARQYAETSPLMSHAPYIVALDEIERQAKRIAELDAEAQSYHDRKEEFAGRIAELKESLDDEKYENADALIDICKLRTALKELGQAKRERGKALVEKEACLTYNTPDEDGHLPIFDFDELSSDAQDLLRERAREQLRREGLL